MSNTPRVRFAPSPTGYLHVGGARTALFNWLFARREGGVFVLRIEDTDRARSSEAMTQAILDGMRWLGLEWDEGPHFQADGVDRHRRDALTLLETRHAYRCFCTTEVLEARRAQQGASADAFRYDRHCLRTLTPEESAQRAAAGQPFALRFHVPDGMTSWEDRVYGGIDFENAHIEDFIVLRSDSTPVYNMAVVSDDVAMAITHVIRGDDHISNTPKQILLYQALERPLPVFAHLPMILGPDGKRLSKRHGATAVGEYHALGILPRALVNFLALLGWSPGDDDEILPLEEIIRRFSLEAINKKSAVFDTQKLEWMNGRYLAGATAEELAPLVSERINAHSLADEAALRARWDWLLRLVELLKTRARTVDELAILTEPYVRERVSYDPAAVEKYWKERASVRARLNDIRERFAAADAWEPGGLEEVLRGLATELGVGAGKLIHPLRVALIGTAAGPGIFDVAVMLGRDAVLSRIDAALDALQNGA
jgi:glutamyl-tRNA synthetase